MATKAKPTRKKRPAKPIQSPDLDAIDRLEQELKTESDRGAVLIAGAMLEEALRNLLLTHLVPAASSTDTLLDGPNSPFGTYAAKIDGAFRLGLISPKFARDLHIIRRLRNDVAHAPKGFSFSDPHARERVMQLCKSHGIYERSPRWVASSKTAPNSRDQFSETSSWMLFFLTGELARVVTLTTPEPEFGYTMSMDDE